MNHIPQVAKMLKLELYEEFETEVVGGILYRFTDTGFENRFVQHKQWRKCNFLNELLAGKLGKIKRREKDNA